MGNYMYGDKKLQPLPRIEDLRYNNFMDTDGYKYSHWKFLPKDTSHMKLYFAHRGGRYSNIQFAGLQRVINSFVANKPEMWMYDELVAFCPEYGVRANLDKFKKIVELGYWPVTIKAVKEGSLIPKDVPLLTVEASGEFSWVAPFIENIIMRVYTCSMTASISYHIRKVLEPYVALSCENMEWLKYMLIGFGARATTVPQQAEYLTAGHLFNFVQDDTVLGVRATNHYYKHKMSATSVAAMEHNTIIIWGKDHESDAYENAIDACEPGDILSMVIDSYDSMQGIRKIHALHDKVKAKGLKVTFRPDSGIPAQEHKACRDLIAELYGTYLNGKSFKVFKEDIHLLYGDGIREDVIAQIMQEAVGVDRYSAECFLFGSGEHLLQDFTRGTNGFMMKLCWATVGGMNVAVCKETRNKKTLAGDVDVVFVKGKYEALLKQADFADQSCLELVYHNGNIYRQHELAEIRRRVWGENF